MELEIYIDKIKTTFKHNFTEDFEVECPFCVTPNKYIIKEPRDLYCKKCDELIVFVVDRKLIKDDITEEEDSEQEEYSEEENIEFLKELTETSDIELIEIMKNKKDRFNEDLIRLLDNEIITAFETNNQDKLENLLYLSKVLDNFKIRQIVEEQDEKTQKYEYDDEKKEEFLEKLLSVTEADFKKIIETQKEKFSKHFLRYIEKEIIKSFDKDNQECLDRLIYLSKELSKFKTQQPIEKKPETDTVQSQSPRPEIITIYCTKCRFENKKVNNFFCDRCGSTLKRFRAPTGGIKPLKEGFKLIDRYEIIKGVKIGGMGAVYKAKDTKTGKTCAIKELLQQSIEQNEQNEAVKRFETEAKLLSNIIYNGIPEVIDYFAIGYRYYLVMEFIDGKDLNSILIERGNPGIKEKDVIDWALQLCDIINYLHTRNPVIIYKDLKPSNIILRKSDNNAILIDFGIAQHWEKGKEYNYSKTAIGTVGYMPPEQYRGKPEPQSDIYSLGATMHHLLTGVKPISFTFMPISSISPELNTIIMKCLNPIVEERFSSATEVKDRLISYMKAKKELSIPPSIKMEKTVEPEGISPEVEGSKYSTYLLNEPVEIKEEELSIKDIPLTENLKNEYIKKVRGIIYDVDIDGFSFLCLMFNKDKFDVDGKDFKELFYLINYDPGLALRVMGSGQSAYYGHTRKKATMIKAMNLLGTNRVSQMISKTLESKLFRNIKHRENFKNICYHSLGVGIYSKLLARPLQLDEDDMYMVGIMHDIGKILLYASMPDEYEEIIKLTRESIATISETEKKYLGFDHSEIGKMALSTWNYPEKFINIAQYHHNIEIVKNPQLYKELLCIQAANVLCNLSKIGIIENIRTMRFEIFDKKTKELVKGIVIPDLMIQAKMEINRLEDKFL